MLHQETLSLLLQDATMFLRRCSLSSFVQFVTSLNMITSSLTANSQHSLLPPIQQHRLLQILLSHLQQLTSIFAVRINLWTQLSVLKVRLLVGVAPPQVYRMDAETEVKNVGGLLVNRVAILLLQRLHLSQAVAPPEGHLVPKTVIVVVGTVRVKGRIPSLANKEVVIMGR